MIEVPSMKLPQPETETSPLITTSTGGVEMTHARVFANHILDLLVVKGNKLSILLSSPEFQSDVLAIFLDCSFR